MNCYTYYLYHIPTKQHYYGVQFNKKANPKDLWSKYFSSSKRVHYLIDEYGADSFLVQIRKIFDCPRKAIEWEKRVLTKLNAANRSDWLNCTNADNQYMNKGGYKLTEEQKQARRGKPAWNKGVPTSEHVKEKLKQLNKGRTPWNKGVPRSEKFKELQSKLMIGENNPMYGKSAVKGRKWYNNGAETIYTFPDEVPDGFVAGRGKIEKKKGWKQSDASKEKRSIRMKGVSNHMFGKIHTDAAKTKISEKRRSR